MPWMIQAQISHVEPLNWWVGMKNPEVQLLINGSKVGETSPSIAYPGVSIKKVYTADSKNYLFLDVVISKKAKPGTFDIQFKKDGKIIYTYPYTLLPRQQDGSQLKGFDASDVVYLIVPDRFANGDSKNDVVEGMLENNMSAYSYHGYAVTDHYKVDPRFGTLDDYKELAQKARKKGIKLIFDEVLNHTGSNYWWMKDLPFKNWFNFQDSLVLTNHRRTVNMDLYAADFDKNLWERGWFDKTMCDMNGENPFMAKYLIQSSIWWIETLQLGGIRQDTYGYSDKTMLKNWSCSILDEYSNFNLVGEEWSVNPLITSYWQRGKKNHDGYDGCLPTVMDFPLQSALVEFLTTKDLAGNGMSSLYEALANDFVYANPNNILVLGDNHDMDRIFMQLNKDVDLTKMALTYLLTIRGIPQIYYGTEILMDNTGHHKVDGLIRSDFPGGWSEDAANAFTGKGLTPEQLNAQMFLK